MEKKQIAVLGLSKFGASMAVSLCEMGQEVLGVDKDAGKVDDYADRLTHCVQADIMDENAVDELGLRNFDAVVVSVGDVQTSIIVTMMLKDKGVGHVVVKALNDQHVRILERIGADKVVFPERDMGVKLAHSMAHNNILDYIEINDKMHLMEVVANEEWFGKSLKELNMRGAYGMNVVAIRSANEEINVSPVGEDVIHRGDTLLVIGSGDDVAKLDRIRFSRSHG